MFPVFYVEEKLLRELPEGMQEIGGILVEKDAKTGLNKFSGIVFKDKEEIIGYVENVIKELKQQDLVLSSRMAEHCKHSLCLLTNYFISSITEAESSNG